MLTDATQKEVNAPSDIEWWDIEDVIQSLSGPTAVPGFGLRLERSLDATTGKIFEVGVAPNSVRRRNYSVCVSV